jgi:hypothetical protein
MEKLDQLAHPVARAFQGNVDQQAMTVRRGSKV